MGKSAAAKRKSIHGKQVSSKLGKGTASQPSRSSVLSPTGSGGGQVRRLVMGANPSHYSSINQVLIEHDDEESEVSHRNLK